MYSFACSQLLAKDILQCDEQPRTLLAAIILDNLPFELTVAFLLAKVRFSRGVGSSGRRRRRRGQLLGRAHRRLRALGRVILASLALRAGTGILLVRISPSSSVRRFRGVALRVCPHRSPIFASTVRLHRSRRLPVAVRASLARAFTQFSSNVPRVPRARARRVRPRVRALDLRARSFEEFHGRGDLNEDAHRPQFRARGVAGVSSGGSRSKKTFPSESSNESRRSAIAFARRGASSRWSERGVCRRGTTISGLGRSRERENGGNVGGWGRKRFSPSSVARNGVVLARVSA